MRCNGDNRTRGWAIIVFLNVLHWLESEMIGIAGMVVGMGGKSFKSTRTETTCKISLMH